MSNKYPLTNHSHTHKTPTHYNKMFKRESPVSSAKIQVIQNQDWNLRPSPWLCRSLSRAESEILENQQLWSFEEVSTNINQDDNWCYECCCTSTDLLASFLWEGKPVVDVSSCGPSGRLLMWRLWRLLMWRLCWGRSLQLGFYARQSYLVFSTQASFGFFVGSISRSIFRSSCPLNLNILLLVQANKL